MLHDYQCGEDGTVLADQYRSADEGASAHPPSCPTCGQAMAWLPQARFDLRSDSGTSAIPKFVVRDGRNALVEIDSLHKLRQVERDSEQAARDGEGQQMVFRAYANTRGNRLDGTLDPPSPVLDPAAKRKFGLRGGARALAGKPDRSYGPGVSDANASALKD